MIIVYILCLLIFTNIGANREEFYRDFIPYMTDPMGMAFIMISDPEIASEYNKIADPEVEINGISKEELKIRIDEKFGGRIDSLYSDFSNEIKHFDRASEIFRKSILKQAYEDLGTAELKIRKPTFTNEHGVHFGDHSNPPEKIQARISSLKGLISLAKKGEKDPEEYKPYLEELPNKHEFQVFYDNYTSTTKPLSSRWELFERGLIDLKRDIVLFYISLLKEKASTAGQSKPLIAKKSSHTITAVSGHTQLSTETSEKPLLPSKNANSIAVPPTASSPNFISTPIAITQETEIVKESSERIPQDRALTLGPVVMQSNRREAAVQSEIPVAPIREVQRPSDAQGQQTTVAPTQPIAPAKNVIQQKKTTRGRPTRTSAKPARQAAQIQKRQALLRAAAVRKKRTQKKVQPKSSVQAAKKSRVVQNRGGSNNS